MKETINPTECAIIELVRQKTTSELGRRVPCIDNIDYRRLAYLLIETRRAAYKENGTPHTLISVLHEFNVQKCDTYYEWRLKWYRLLPEHIKRYVR